MDKISEKIISEAAKKAKEIEKKALLKAEMLNKENNNRLNKITMEYQDKIDKIYSIELNRLKSAAQMEFKKDILRAKSEIIKKIYAYVSDYIKKDKKIYADFLKAMAVKGTVSGNEVIIVSNNDESFFSKKFISSINKEAGERLGCKTNLALATELRNTGGGLYLKEGKIEFNATLNVVIDTLAEEFEMEIVDFLFE